MEKFTILISRDGCAEETDLILITKEQKMLLNWLEEKGYLDENTYILNDIQDLTQEMDYIR